MAINIETVALGTDHAGYELKEIVKTHLDNKGLTVQDFGAHSNEQCDYPTFCRPAAEAVAVGDADVGIVFGGSGNGEQMVANKVKGIRCALCWNESTATLAKEHNNANVISLGARQVTEEMALKIVDAWLVATFEGGRHLNRINLIEA